MVSYKPKEEELDDQEDLEEEEEMPVSPKKQVVRKEENKPESGQRINLTNEDIVALVKDYNQKITLLLSYLE